MPATESTWRNQALLHRIFAVSGVLLTLTTVWMFYKDHARSWKVIQPKALAVEQKMTLWREEQVKATELYQSHSLFEEQLRKAETNGIDPKLIAEFNASLADDATNRKTSVSQSKLDRMEREVETLNDRHAEAVEARKEADAAAKAAEKDPSDQTMEKAAADAIRISQKKDDDARAERKKIIDELKSWAYNA